MKSPRIVTQSERKLIGRRLMMSFADFKMGELWSGFMPRRKDIAHPLNNDLISLVVYQPNHFQPFKPTNEFERWAAVEVANFEQVPPGMETFTLPVGLYAVFDYQGLPSDPSIFQYIFNTWLPGSDYVLDDRPHFEVLGDKYKNNDPTSEEEIWIPIRKRNE